MKRLCTKCNQYADCYPGRANCKSCQKATVRDNYDKEYYSEYREKNREKINFNGRSRRARKRRARELEGYLDIEGADEGQYLTSSSANTEGTGEEVAG